MNDNSVSFIVEMFWPENVPSNFFGPFDVEGLRVFCDGPMRGRRNGEQYRVHSLYVPRDEYDFSLAHFNERKLVWLKEEIKELEKERS